MGGKVFAKSVFSEVHYFSNLSIINIVQLLSCRKERYISLVFQTFQFLQSRADRDLLFTIDKDEVSSLVSGEELSILRRQYNNNAFILILHAGFCSKISWEETSSCNVFTFIFLVSSFQYSDSDWRPLQLVETRKESSKHYWQQDCLCI